MYYAGHTGMHLEIYRDFPEHGMAYLNEISFGIQTDGSKLWHQHYGYPVVGASVFYGLLGNSDVFGQNIGITPQITFRTRIKKNWLFQPTLGMGFSYFNKPNDPVTNPENYMIGSKITNMSYASFYWLWNKETNWAAKFGFSYIHCSNGHYQLPNIGMNLPSLSIAIMYSPAMNFTNYTTSAETSLDKKVKFNVQFGLGVQEFGKATAPIDGKKYPVYITTFYLSKRYGKISNVHCGISAIHYLKYYDYFLENNEYKDEEFGKSSVVTMFLAHEFLAGHIGFLAQGGINVYSPLYKESFHLKDNIWMNNNSFLESFISTKIGFNFYLFNTEKHLSNNVSFGLFMKANFGQADFVESNIGYRF